VKNSNDLQRFVDAQDQVIDRVLAELRRGRKDSHWMWFVFPQVAGLGVSEMSRRYAIESLREAREYLTHPILGARLRECTRILLDVPASSSEEVFGPIDARKLRSAMTLFARAEPGERVFQQVLDRWYGGQADPATLRLIEEQEARSNTVGA
jgi:uncharacterized protein (DUF1810 family)